MKASGKHLSLEVPGLAENRPSVLKGDKIYAQVYASGNAASPEPVEYEGFVREVEDTSIKVGFSQKLRNKYTPNMQFNIRFTFNRFPLRNMHRATEFMAQKQDYHWCIFPEIRENIEGHFPPVNSAYFDGKIKNNLEQSRAVSSIVQGGISGIPYIIFGPPGTGKTVTITEAIKQVWKTKPESRIIASAPSNSAADLLALHLIKQVP